MSESEGELGPLEFSVLEKLGPASRQLIAGGVAGCIAKTTTAPLARLTILFQVHSLVSTKPQHPEFASGMIAGMRKVVQREGFFAFWKGNGTSVLHRFPYSAINFAVFERAKPAYSRAIGAGESETAAVRLLAGASAGGVATCACYPLDLVRTRLATQHVSQAGYYRGILHALTRIAGEEGVAGLYRGLGTSLCVQVPSLAMSYTIYGTLKEKAATVPVLRDAATGEATTAATLACGAASGVASSLVTYPLDVVRRRMQIEGLHVHGHLRGPVEELRYIVAHEGARGLYRGLAPELLKVCPMICLTFGTYEMMREKLGISATAGARANAGAGAGTGGSSGDAMMAAAPAAAAAPGAGAGSRAEAAGGAAAAEVGAAGLSVGAANRGGGASSKPSSGGGGDVATSAAIAAGAGAALRSQLRGGGVVAAGGTSSLLAYSRSNSTTDHRAGGGGRLGRRGTQGAAAL